MSSSRDFMHPNARAALEAAEKAANLSLIIVQTQGDAVQSAGTHASDGHYTMANGRLHSYCCAVDFSVRQPATRLSDGKKMVLDSAHIKWWLYQLACHGFVAWYRRPSQGFDGPHAHAVFCGASMKPMLQAQVRDFLSGKDGLRGHRKEEFWTHPEELDAALKKLFDEHN